MAVLVNGEKVLEEEVQANMLRMRPQFEQAFPEEDPETKEQKLQEWAEENVIERILLTQAAMRDMEPAPPEKVEELWKSALEKAETVENLLERSGMESEEAIRADMEKHLRMEAFIQKMLSEIPPPTEEDIRAFYDENIEHLTQPEMVQASHIVKHLSPDSDRDALMEEMKKVQKQLRNNGFFADLAKEHSDCPDQGGDLGFFPRGQMVPAFEDVVFNMQVGEISDVFETEFGFHIAKVTDKKDAAPVDFDEYKEKIAEHAQRMQQQKVIEAFVDAEKQKATIERSDA